MAQRKPYVGGNWKMNLHLDEAQHLAEALVGQIKDDSVEVVVFPALPYLLPVGKKLSDAGGPIKLGAQDFYHEANGAYTGEVSLSMLQDVGCQVALVGHSERRHVIGESDVLLNEKVLAAVEAGLEVVLCIGETLEQREAGKTDAINWGQLGYGLAGVSAQQMSRVTIAYEPVWAIGTGEVCPAEEADRVCGLIRTTVEKLYSADVAQAVRIQYGGSVKSDNAADLLGRENIDGALVGGASLKAADFAAIVKAAPSS